jgi:hypothetical protein
MKNNQKPPTENEQRNEFERDARMVAITEPDKQKRNKLFKDLGKWIKAGRPLIQANKG